MKKTIKTISAFALVATLSLVAFGIVTFDPATGFGFVGKGDVQLALGYNNKQLQDNLGNFSFEYSASSVTVEEYEWTCTNTNNDNVQERSRTTTTTNSTQGVVSSVERVKNQITGFRLTGYSGPPTIVNGPPVTEGQPLNSCPTNWVLTPAGDPVVTTEVTGGGLSVNGASLQ